MSYRFPGNNEAGVSPGKVSAGGFAPTVTVERDYVASRGGLRLTTCTATAASREAGSYYLWFRNGELVTGGTNGTLLVRWRSGDSLDSYEALLVMSNGRTQMRTCASAPVEVHNLPSGLILGFR